MAASTLPIYSSNDPLFPVILDWDGRLLPVRDFECLVTIVYTLKFIPMREYLLIDSLGTSWCLFVNTEEEFRIFKSELITKLSKRMFVKGFNKRKNAKSCKRLRLNPNHLLFSELFTEIFRILEEENESETLEDIEL